MQHDPLAHYRQRMNSGKDKKASWTSNTPLLVFLGCGALVVLVLIVLLLAGGDGDEMADAPAPRKTVRRSRDAHRSKPTRRSRSGGGGHPLAGGGGLADLMQASGDASTPTDTVTGLLETARQAMAVRDLKAARRDVDAAADLARSPTEQDAAQRVDKLLGCLETFWRNVDQELRSLSSGQDIAVGDSRLMIIEAGGGAITVRRAGKFQQYTAADVPPVLAVALAERRLLNTLPATHLIIGAFWAVDAQGDPAEARRHWQQAGEQGEAMMVELPAP